MDSVLRFIDDDSLRGEAAKEAIKKPSRRLRAHEPHAQILRCGKLHRPTEFGQMVQVREVEGGIVTNIDVVPDKNDKSLLVPAVERV